MKENNFQSSIEAIISGKYTNSDIKEVKLKLSELQKNISLLKHIMDKEANIFKKNKEKQKNEIKLLNTQIKDIKNILKNIN